VRRRVEDEAIIVVWPRTDGLIARFEDEKVEPGLLEIIPGC
jgi:hypothetical protein